MTAQTVRCGHAAQIGIARAAGHIRRTGHIGRTVHSFALGAVLLALPMLGGVGPGRHLRSAVHRPARPLYAVSANRIIDAAGRTVAVHGVDRPSLEWSCTRQPVTGSGSGIPATDFATMRADGANTVRIALNEDSWLSSSDRMPVADPCPTYVATVTAAVTAARRAGLAVVLDLHWSDADQPALPAAQQCAPDRDSLTFWREVASSERGDGGVWCELYNEPHDITWAQWRDGGAITCAGRSFQAVGMQSLVDAVRAAGASNVVLVGGLDWAYDLPGALAEHLLGANVAYATHPYAGKGGGSADWPRAFGDVARSVPVVATEFGRTDCAASSPYDQQILDYLRTRGVGYTAWAWFSGGCGFPSLLTGSALSAVGALTMSDEQAIANGSAPFTLQPYTPPA